MSGLRTCAHCHRELVPEQDGTCPNCGHSFGEVQPTSGNQITTATAVKPDSQNPYAAPREQVLPRTSRGLRGLLDIGGGVLLFFSAFVLLLVVLTFPESVRRAPKDYSVMGAYFQAVCFGAMAVVPPAFSAYSLLRSRWRTGLIVMFLYFGFFFLLLIWHRAGPHRAKSLNERPPAARIATAA